MCESILLKSWNGVFLKCLEIYCHYFVIIQLNLSIFYKWDSQSHSGWSDLLKSCLDFTSIPLCMWIWDQWSMRHHWICQTKPVHLTHQCDFMFLFLFFSLERWWHGSKGCILAKHLKKFYDDTIYTRRTLRIRIFLKTRTWFLCRNRVM